MENAELGSIIPVVIVAYMCGGALVLWLRAQCMAHPRSKACYNNDTVIIYFIFWFWFVWIWWTLPAYIFLKLNGEIDRF